MIEIDEINENNIEEVLRQIGFEFDNFEILSKDLSKSKYCKPANFVVKMDNDVKAIDLLNSPVDDPKMKSAIFKFYSLLDNLSLKVNTINYCVLSTFEDSRVISISSNEIYLVFNVYSLKDVSV